MATKTGPASGLSDLTLIDRYRGAGSAEGVGLTYHIAVVFRSASHPDSYYTDINEDGTLHVIDAAKRHRVPRVVHCSTVGVHGQIMQIPRTEESPYNPGDIYQVTNLKGEKRMQEAIAAGLPGVIFRPAGL